MSGVPGPRLGVRRTAALLWRLCFLQAAWSYERMQSVGLAAALAGEGRRLAGGDPEAARSFLSRHLGFFNTNPVAASGLAGALVRLEEEGGAAGDAAAIARFKQVLAGPAAAWGDTLFWATLRPVATALGAAAALAAGAWGPILYLVGYNAVHFYWRLRLLDEGYARGAAFGPWLSQSGFRTWPGRLRPAGILLLGAAIGISCVDGGRALGGAGVALVAGAAGVAALVLRNPARTGTPWGYVAVAAGLIHAALTR